MPILKEGESFTALCEKMQSESKALSFHLKCLPYPYYRGIFRVDGRERVFSENLAALVEQYGFTLENNFVVPNDSLLGAFAKDTLCRHFPLQTLPYPLPALLRKDKVHLTLPLLPVERTALCLLLMNDVKKLPLFFKENLLPLRRAYARRLRNKEGLLPLFAFARFCAKQEAMFAQKDREKS